LPAPAPPAGGEQDTATASGAAPAGLPCRSITGAKICYQADGDTWWVEDTASDSASAVVVWRDYLGGALTRQGMCVNSQGEGKWGRCVKDYDEASALYGAPCVIDRSANKVIRCDPAYRQYQ
jgi:hypothetical protein